MAVRKTESRLPAGMQPTDLGQAVTAANPAVHLISFLADTVAVRRTQTYVVFVTDAALAATIGNYEWAINDAGTAHNLTTSIGVIDYTSQAIGTLSVTVRLRDTANSADVASVTMTKSVVALFNALELLIDQQESNTPKAAHPETSREIVNDLRAYIDAIIPTADALNPLLLALTYGTLLREPTRRGGAAVEVLPGPRMVRLEGCASRLNATPATSFLADAGGGIGVCQLRPQLLALYLIKPGGAATYLPARTLRTGTADRQVDVTQWETDFNALPATDQLDLFNLIRFPKTCFRLVRTVLEGLVGTCFPSDTVPAVLADSTKTRQLLAQFRAGPVMPLTGLAATGSDTRIQQFTLLPLWAITPRLVLASAGGGAGAAAGSGAAPPAPVGSPEHIPEHTFIADFVTESVHPQTGAALTSDQISRNVRLNQFISEAILYHETYGLTPTKVTSFEQIIELTAALPAPLLINRLRIVSHLHLGAGEDDSSNIMIPFFRNQKLDPLGRGGTEAWQFAYGLNDEAGMTAYLLERQVTPLTEQFTQSNYTVMTKVVPVAGSPGNFIQAEPREIVDVLLDLVRGTNPSVLVPFQLRAPRSRLTGNSQTFVRICCDLYVLAHSPDIRLSDVLNPAVVAHTFARSSAVFQAVVAKYNAVSETFAAQLVRGSITIGHVIALKSALLACSLSDFVRPAPNPPNSPVSIPLTSLNGPNYLAETSILDNHDTLRANLATLRAKLTSNSSVDIRGCRLGLDLPYMRVLRTFFGDQAKVTAPDWFQQFRFMTKINPSQVTNEATIDALFTRRLEPGFPQPADVQREYSTWAGRIGIAAHLAFWQRLTDAATDPLEFLAYDWRNALPGLGMQAGQLNGFVALPFGDALTRLSQVFNVLPASIPTAGAITTFSTSLLPLTTRLWRTATALRSLTATTPVVTLTTHQTELVAIATLLGPLLPGTPNPTTLLPAAPNPITFQYLTDCVQQLTGRIMGQFDIVPFLTAIRQQLSVPTAGLRYMLRIGIPLAVQQGGTEGNILFLCFDSLKDAAAKNWMRAQWAEPLPAGNSVNGLVLNWAEGFRNTQHTDTFTDDTLTSVGMALQVAALTNTRQADRTTVVAICPTTEYMQHIVTVP